MYLLTHVGTLTKNGEYLDEIGAYPKQTETEVFYGARFL